MPPIYVDPYQNLRCTDLKTEYDCAEYISECLWFSEISQCQNFGNLPPSKKCKHQKKKYSCINWTKCDWDAKNSLCFFTKNKKTVTSMPTAMPATNSPSTSPSFKFTLSESEINIWFFVFVLLSSLICLIIIAHVLIKFCFKNTKSINDSSENNKNDEKKEEAKPHPFSCLPSSPTPDFVHQETPPHTLLSYVSSDDSDGSII